MPTAPGSNERLPLNLPLTLSLSDSEPNLFAKKKWSSSGETDIARGARTDKADAKFESESPHHSRARRADRTSHQGLG
jgi:hypothetical protein